MDSNFDMLISGPEEQKYLKLEKNVHEYETIPLF